jgi:diaminopimelate epimerase
VKTRRGLPFTKMQGVGNDMILVDARADPGIDRPGLAQAMCDRHRGIGADGLLVIERSARCDAAMRMYNPDGTPDFCGNGLRCVARFVAERTAPGMQEGERRLRIATIAGEREAIVRSDARTGCRITVDMGSPRYRPEEIPMRASGDRFWEQPLRVGGRTLTVTALSTGSTHTVVFVNELPDDPLFFRVSPLVENHPRFPERTSVMWARVESRNRLELRIWERGAGETLGCGTGACAAAVAARNAGLTDEEVTVASKGGELRIRWSEGQDIRMTGPAEVVFEGEYWL